MHPYRTPPASKSINTLAIVSVIAGLFSWTAAPLVAAFVAIICGHMARGQIRKSGEDGDVLAIVGLAMGYANVLIGCLLTAFLVIFYAGLFGLAAAGGMR